MKTRAVGILGVAAIFAGLCGGFEGLQAQTEDAVQKQAVEIFKQLIEINTTDSVGSTTVAAEAMAKRLRDAGFPASDVQVLGPTDRKRNMVARLHGTGAKKPILFIGHTDVVEARRTDWTTDPFEFVVQDGYYYGRGTNDMKSEDAIMVETFIRLKQEGYKPDRDLILALTADEEGGGPYNGVAWLLKNHRELIDAELALNEGGKGTMVNGKRVSNDLQAAEKWYLDLRLEVHNKGGHSSQPVPDNAIYHLANALVRVSQVAFPLKTNEVTRAYFGGLAKIDTTPMKTDLEQAAQGDPAAMERVARSSPAWNSMLRTTCVATMLEGGHARNALPQLAAANINCRVHPDDSLDYVIRTLRDAIADNQVAISVTNQEEKAPPSPLRPDILRAMARTTDSMWPGVTVLPYMATGATDGRMLRDSGIPCYGVQGLFVERDDNRAHGRDERMLQTSFYEAQTFLYELVKNLSTAQ